ncbi:CU044_2847 family protein [Actinomadura terrae]|uniref:CU044_2847 family protein n=1 Tax=Actinomadura terrae TaxID=604353 RepID=UPI001FA6CBB2|nr:CU044_2847 family protein [Actinomadura terrae]
MGDSTTVELQLPEGGSVLVRAEQVDGGRGGPANIGVKDALSFSAVSSALRGIAAEVHRAVAAVRPDVAEVEFGLEVAVKNSKVMCLLVDGETKATLKVRLEWNANGKSDRGGSAPA